MMEILGTKVRYEYHFEGDGEKAKAVAKNFHEALKGNEDYVESRILLYWNNGIVEVYEFSDSRTAVRIMDNGPGLPKLTLTPYVPIFWGLFFDGEPDLPKGTLERDVEHKHVTFGYKKPMPMHLLGRKSSVIVDGYGNDGDNEALFVELDPDIQEYHDGGRADSPYHITLSTSENGKPVDSAKLDCQAIGRPYVLEGTFGYCTIVGGTPTVVTGKERP